MRFRHERIDDDPPNDEGMLCLPTDLTGNGRDDVIIGVRNGSPTLFWYENPGWDCHHIGEVPGLEAGGALGDVTGNGRLDVIAGGHLGQHELYWFEQPEDPRDPWPARVITNDFHKYHDQAFADVDDDGEPEIVVLSQGSEVICYYDIPDDPRQESWPGDDRTFVAAGLGRVEGIQVLDLDGDGRTELVVGRHIFHREDEAGQAWSRERLAPDWDDERVRVVAADVDGEGQPELVLSEGERPALHSSPDPARLGLCSAPNWDAEVLRDDLHGPHSLVVADFDGDGHPDIYVAESDYGGHENPRHFVLENLGDGTFDHHLVEEGIGTHEAKLADLTGNGTLDLVGKTDTDDTTVDAWFNESAAD